jgi:hypothetical protein
MGAQDRWGVFITAALPILPPGFYQLLTWPLTFGVALLLSPLALLRRRHHYLIAVCVYASAIGATWVLAWLFDPDRLNLLWGAPTYDPARLDSVVLKSGVILLTHISIVLVTVSLWFWRSEA